MMTDQKRIRPLPVSLANQIAAGEVIERPASVLKELLENSLDAKSTQIDIHIERGGIGLIRVQDNGSGICKEDLKLALAAHATSKIESLTDLENVLSYGFRGEALASIGAVSRLQLSSWVPDQEFGWCVQLEGREGTPNLMPVPKRAGTIIEVRDLFYNTPARRHFLRSERTEMAYLEEMFKRVALSQFKVAFKFQQGERLQKRLPICQNAEAEMRRVAMLCGQSFISDAFYIQAESNGLALRGWLGLPKYMRAAADLQYFYVNGRIVRDKVVTHAVRQAYQDVAIPGRFPAYVLYFECDPRAVDVNVHPTKHEVRFREARTVHAFLSYTIQEGLKQEKSSVTKSTVFEEKEEVKKLAAIDLSFLRSYREDDTHWRPYHQVVEPKRFTPAASVTNVQIAATTGTKPLFIVNKEFLFIENAVGLQVVNIKEARRAWIQASLGESYPQEGVSKRALLMPKSIAMGKRVEKLETSEIDWVRLGFEISQVGHEMILVRTVPSIFGDAIQNLDKLMLKLLGVSTIEEGIATIADFLVNQHVLSDAEIKQFWLELQDINKTQHKINLNHCSKEFTLEQLRSFFG